jgi:GT2 family glycosyltransferase
VSGVVELCVAVVTYNSESVIGDLLASLPGALGSLPSVEVVVVDNASTDHTLEVVAASAPQARVIAAEHNGGYASAINLAASTAPTRAMLITNADVRFGPESIAHLLAALDVPGVGIAVPQEIGRGGLRDNSLRRRPSVLRTLAEALLGGSRAARWGLGEAVAGDAVYAAPAVADWASGAVQMVSRRCLDATGPWDESYFLYSEETDFDLRAGDAGFALRYVPDARIEHDCGDMTTSPALWSLRAVNRVVLHRRRHGTVRGWLFWGAVLLHEAIRSPGSSTHRAAVRALLRHASTDQTRSPGRTLVAA